MIAFNLIYAMVIRENAARMERRSARFDFILKCQMHRLETGQLLESGHLRRLGRKLSRIHNLMAFDRALDRLQTEDDPQLVQQYLSQIRPVILHLAVVYRKRESLQSAYFAYFLHRHKVEKYMPVEMIQRILLDYMKKDSLYCRVNALKALCAFGSPEHILRAVEIQDRGNGFLHEKILTECLLTYKGKDARLIQSFWERMDQFTLQTRHALLNYIRFQSGNYCTEMFRIMDDPNQNRELRFAAIRYFGRYTYPPAREKLLHFLSEQNTRDWEYAAISAAALGSYPGEDVVRALVLSMHSRNWYIRYNAAASLEAHYSDYGRLLELVGSQDRYAREMLFYRMELHYIEQRTEEKTATAEEITTTGKEVAAVR